MCLLSVPFTALSVAMVCIMLVVTTKCSALSGRCFAAQQHDLGEVDGFIEEMMDGQKVVRVFCHEDEAPEEDHGYVELVNAREAPDGSLEPCEERTGVWVWRHPHAADGSVTYHKLEGALVMDHVDFGYTPDKRVLHDITLYANPGQKIAFVGSTGASSSGAAMTSSWRSAAATGRSIPEALRTTDRLVARPDTREGTRLRPRPLTYGQA